MTIPQYDDFELELTAGADGSYLAAVRSTAGEARQPFGLAFDPVPLADWTTQLATPATAPATAPQSLGAQLFNAVFTGSVLSLYDGSCALARQEGHGLRLRLRVLAPALAALPWELLYDGREQSFVALSQQTPIVRTVETMQPMPELKVQLPLRVLVMAPQPIDLPALDAARERTLLQQALARLGRQVELVWVEGQSWRDLQAALQQGPWHVFHFVGHGAFDAGGSGSDPTGGLLFAGDQGRAELRTGEEIARLLADAPSLRLVVLNACRGAQSAPGAAYASLAETLLRRGLPSVLAMQTSIGDAAAVEFTRSFYGALGNGLPVDAASAEARKAIDAAAAGGSEWATPVLYLCSADGILWATPQRHFAWLPALYVGRFDVAPVGLAVLLLALMAGGVWFYVHRPAPLPRLTGAFNIVVAGIGVLEADGAMRQSDFGDFVASSILARMQQEYAAAQPGSALPANVQFWPDPAAGGGAPPHFVYVDGATPEERSRRAAELAQRTNANMVIYGHLDPAQNTDSLALEFYYATPIENGAVDAASGTQELGTPIRAGLPFAVNEGAARLRIQDPLEQRAAAIFWLIQSLAYELADKPDQALQVITKASGRLQNWPDEPGQGKEVLHLFRGRAAAAVRQYDLALQELNRAIELNPDYAPAYGVKGTLLTDKAQLYFVQASQRQLTAEEARCTSLANLQNADATLAAARQDIDTAIQTLQQGIAVAPRSFWPPIEHSLHSLLGLAYRLQGQERIFADDAVGAAAALANAEKEFATALQSFPAADEPALHATAQAGLAATHQLQAHIQYVQAQTANDATVCRDHQQQAVALFQKAADGYQTCIDQGKNPKAAGNLVFQDQLLQCACIPYKGVADKARADAAANLCKKGVNPCR